MTSGANAPPAFPLRCPSCAHGNPAAANFCNHCGMPVNLEPCRFCEAINKRSDVACHKCGILLARPAAAPAEKAAELATELASATASAAAYVTERRAMPPPVGTPKVNAPSIPAGPPRSGAITAAGTPKVNAPPPLDAPPPRHEARPGTIPGPSTAPTNEQRPPVRDAKSRPTVSPPLAADARATAVPIAAPTTADVPRRPADPPPRVDTATLQAGAPGGTERREPTVGLEGVHRAAALAAEEDPDDEAAAAQHRRRFGRTAFLFVLLLLLGGAAFFAARDPARFQDGIDAVERKVMGGVRMLLPPRQSPAVETMPSSPTPAPAMTSPADISTPSGTAQNAPASPRAPADRRGAGGGGTGGDAFARWRVRSCDGLRRCLHPPRLRRPRPCLRADRPKRERLRRLSARCLPAQTRSTIRARRLRPRARPKPRRPSPAPHRVRRVRSLHARPHRVQARARSRASPRAGMRTRRRRRRAAARPIPNRAPPLLQKRRPSRLPRPDGNIHRACVPARH